MEYWMASKDPRNVTKELSALHGEWSIWGTNPVAQSWVRNSIMYYSNVIDPSSWDSSLVFEGEQGELVKMMVPQARSLLRQLVTLLTKQKLSFKAIADTIGRDVVADMRLANGLADNIVRDQRLDTKGENLTEQALLYGISFLKACWRTDRGTEYILDPENDAIITNGDLEIQNYSIFDVFFDYAVEDLNDLDWMEVRTIKNRWDIMAQFPQMADIIERLESVDKYRGFYTASQATVSQNDKVFVYEVYHKPTPSLPKGRMVVYASEDVILYDGPNPYECIPVVIMKPESIHGLGMGFGYPFFSNLLPCQEMMDHSFSAIATNQSAFAVQNVLCPRGADISVQEIGGMNWISYNRTDAKGGGGEPKALQLTQTAPETFKFIDVLLSHMQQISNINSALRGEPPPGVTAATAIATLTTNAIEFISSAARSYKEAMEDAVTLGVKGYGTFAKYDRVINIVGRNLQNHTKTFNRDNLKSFDKMQITQVNPILQTLSGRLDLAEKLASNGLVKNLREYLAILDGEPVERIMDTEQSENDLIADENEDMLEGKEVIAIASDDHAMHIREHHALLNSPSIRRESEHLQMILKHIQDHFELMKSTDPLLQAVIRTGQIPEGALQQQPPPQGPPGGGNIGPSPDQPSGPATGPAAPAQDLLGRQPGGPPPPNEPGPGGF